MSSSPEHESFLPPPEDWPEILLAQDGKQYNLRWDNTELRRFRVGNGAYDHLLHELSDEQVMYLFFSELDDSTIPAQLEEADFAVTISPILDETTIRLYSSYFSPALEDSINLEP